MAKRGLCVQTTLLTLAGGTTEHLGEYSAPMIDTLSMPNHQIKTIKEKVGEPVLNF